MEPMKIQNERMYPNCSMFLDTRCARHSRFIPSGRSLNADAPCWDFRWIARECAREIGSWTPLVFPEGSYSARSIKDARSHLDEKMMISAFRSLSTLDRTGGDWRRRGIILSAVRSPSAAARRSVGQGLIINSDLGGARNLWFSAIKHRISPKDATPWLPPNLAHPRECPDSLDPLKGKDHFGDLRPNDHVTLIFFILCWSVVSARLILAWYFRLRFEFAKILISFLQHARWYSWCAFSIEAGIIR